MFKDKIIRAWKDPEFRAELSEEEREEMPENPAGAIELTDDELDMVAGGSYTRSRSCSASRSRSQSRSHSHPHSNSRSHSNSNSRSNSNSNSNSHSYSNSSRRPYSRRYRRR